MSFYHHCFRPSVEKSVFYIERQNRIREKRVKTSSHNLRNLHAYSQRSRFSQRALDGGLSVEKRPVSKNKRIRPTPTPQVDASVGVGATIGQTVSAAAVATQTSSVAEVATSGQTSSVPQTISVAEVTTVGPTVSAATVAQQSPNQSTRATATMALSERAASCEVDRAVAGAQIWIEGNPNYRLVLAPLAKGLDLSGFSNGTFFDPLHRTVYIPLRNFKHAAMAWTM